MPDRGARHWGRLTLLAVLVMLLGYGLVAWGLADMKAHRPRPGAPVRRTQGTPGLLQGGLGVLVMAGGLVFAAVAGSRWQRLRNAPLDRAGGQGQ